MSKEEKINEWFKNYMEERKKEKQIKSSMFSGYEYIAWLDRITKENGTISDEDLLYNDSLNEYDRQGIKNLNLFFDGIQEYATNNYIYPISEPYCELYNIKYNDSGLQLGITYGQGVSLFCKGVKVEEMDEYIDFADIINGKKSSKVEVINKNLERLTTLIYELYDNGVPIEAIRNTCNSVVEELVKKKKENDKGFTI